MPPVFTGTMTGVVNEDDPVGTEVLSVRASDGDTGNSRRIVYSLASNPNGYFVIDPDSGVIRVDKTLDRESLGSSSGGVLSLKVRASELVNGIAGTDATTSSVADVTVTIRDVNDEPPTFNAPEFRVTIPENVPFGTPLGSLDIEVRDTDTGPNSAFKIELIDGSGKFAVEPGRAAGHSAVSLKLNSKNLDYENPNERKFLLLIVATETETPEKLSSTATVTVEVTGNLLDKINWDQFTYFYFYKGRHLLCGQEKLVKCLFSVNQNFHNCALVCFKCGPVCAAYNIEIIRT
jgi:hypothetical protein